MNILFLSETFYPHYGGAELATFLYSKLLSDEGINVRVITNRHQGEERVTQLDNTVIYRLDLFEETKSTKYSTLSRIDVFFSNFFDKMMDWADIVYIPRLWYSAIPHIKRRKIPVVVHLHDYFPICPLSNIYDFSTFSSCQSQNGSCSSKCILSFERSLNRSFFNTLFSLGVNTIIGRNLGKLVKLSDAIICVSGEHKNILVDHIPSLKGKTEFIYNPLPEISSIEMKNNDFGYFGGKNALKGYHVLHKAMDLLKGKLSGRVRVHATKFPLEHEFFYDKVSFLPYGRLDVDEFNSLYENVGTVLVPSVWPEPLPYVVLEALLRGRMLVASKIGGIPEEVEGCKGVILCEPDNEIELADAITLVSSYSREERLEWGIYNKKVIMNNFNDKISLKKFVQVCEKII